MTLSRSFRGLRVRFAQLPSFRVSVPDAPQRNLRDPWAGDPGNGAALLRGELCSRDGTIRLAPGEWAADAPEVLRGAAFGFTWLRDLRAIGTEAARRLARALAADFLGTAGADLVASRPEVAGNRIAAWLAHFDFFAASAEESFARTLMWRLLADTRRLAAALPTEEVDGRAFAALKGVFAASVALPAEVSLLERSGRFLAQEIERQILPDGMHCERSPAAQIAVLSDLIAIRAFAQTGGVSLPPALSPAIERMASALRALRHGDGMPALFNGTRELPTALLDGILAQAGRAGRLPVAMPEGGFHRLQAGRSIVICDAGPPPPPGLDRRAHAGTLAFEFSVGRERLIVNCGAAPTTLPGWHAAARATAAHSTLVIADTSSSEFLASGLGRRPTHVRVQRQEANGAHWLEATHDGWRRAFGALHKRRLYLSESGDDLRGEDSVEAASPLPFVLRFHLHPLVSASLQLDADAVLLRLPSGAGWRLRAEGGSLALEESVYLAGAEPKRAEQVTVTASKPGTHAVKWALTRIG